MHTCIHTYIHTYMHTYIHTHNERIRKNIDIYTQELFIYKSVQIDIYVYMFVYTYILIWVRYSRAADMNFEVSLQ